MNLRFILRVLSACGLLGGLVAPVMAADWFQTLKISGDIRYRIEDTQDEGTTGVIAYQDRQRLRVRLDVQAPLDENWRTEVRLATDESGFAGGNGDPGSRNQTLGDLDSAKPVWLDLGYLEYKPWPALLKLQAGKVPNPFTFVGGNKLLFAADVSWEGMAGNFTCPVTPDTSFFVNGGGFWIREIAKSCDPMLYAAQAGAKSKLLDNLTLTAGLGEFYYTDLTHQFPLDYKTAAPTAAVPGSSKGNTLVTATGFYQDNYYLTEGFLEVAAAVLNLPLKGYADYLLNHGATHFQKAYILGIIVNKADKAGTWEGGYNWRLLEKNSLLAAYADPDFAAATIDGYGHVLTGSYAVTDAAKATLTFIRDRKTLSGPTAPFFNRFQADITLAF